jgi:hypothetical protein
VTPPNTIAIGSSWAVETAQLINFTCNGTVNGVWWYRTAQDTGTNTVTAWRGTSVVAQASGTLATIGWAYLPFATPLPVAAGDQLLLGVHHPNGAYGYQTGGFTGRSVSAGCLNAPATSGTLPNGLYTYTQTPTLPTLSYAASEYFISPDFSQS